MILADENVYGLIIKALREAGIEVFSVYENQRGLSDHEITQISLNPPRLILTEDKGFGDLVLPTTKNHQAYYSFRYTFSETEEITKVLIHLLQTRGKDLWQVCQRSNYKKIRIRNLL